MAHKHIKIIQLHLLNFSSTFPYEESCKIKWREFSDKKVYFASVARNIIVNQTKKYMSVSSVNTVKA